MEADTLRAGSQSIEADPARDEVENLHTTNRILSATIDYATDEQWGISDEIRLQTGNGSTDLILGVFWQHPTSGTSRSHFAQASLQKSINALSNFKPVIKLISMRARVI